MKHPLARSKLLYESALEVAPGGVQGSDLRSKHWGWEPHPIFMARGEGAYVVDVDGNRYIDYKGAEGPLILGHKPEPVIQAVRQTLAAMGPLLGFSHELEVRAAQATIDAVPSWERMRFSNTGTEAVMISLRMARAYTGRMKVLCFEGHYHGWADTIYYRVDEELARSGDGELAPIPTTTGLVEPILPETLVVRPWNDFEVLETTFTDLGSELAAVICEPLLCFPVITPKPGYLERLRELCTKHGVVLIYDEVKTGFRVALGGFQELTGVLPDLCTVAKAMGAGFPVAGFGGRKELFEPFNTGYIRQGSTYQASPLVLAACLATLDVLRGRGFYEELDELGKALAAGLTDIAREAGVTGYARSYVSVVHFAFADHQLTNYRDAVRSSDKAKARDFQMGMLDGGVVCPGGGFFISAAHSADDIAKTLEVARTVLTSIGSST